MLDSQDAQQIHERIGARIRRARCAAGFSQQSLADEVGISKASLSHLEHGKSAPNSGILLRLAKALGYPAEYCLRPVSVSLSAPAHHSRHALPQKQELPVIAEVQEWLERYLDFEDILDEHSQFALPAGFPRRVASS